jgi:hypothetical protein
MPAAERGAIAPPVRRVRRRRVAKGVVMLSLGVLVWLLAQWMLSPGESSRLRSFVYQSNQVWLTGRIDIDQMPTEYAIYASGASTVEPFGQPLVESMARIRQTDYVRDHFPEFYWDQTSGDHYLEFARGPLHSYFMRADELAGDWATERRAAVVEPLLVEGWQGNAPLDRLRPWLPDRFLERAEISRRIERQLAQLHTELRPDGEPLSAEAAARLGEMDLYLVMLKARKHARDLAVSEGMPSRLDKLDRAQQEQVLRGLKAYIRREDPRLWQQLHLVDATVGLLGVLDASDIYSNQLTRPILAVRDSLAWGGLVLVMLGLGTLMRHWHRTGPRRTGAAGGGDNGDGVR